MHLTYFKTLTVISLALLLIPTPDAVAQHDIVFERLGVEQGLSTRYTRTVVQDRFGFMWFGSDNGLNRFDGYSFTIYKHRPGQPGSLSSSNVPSLFQDAGGTLWIGTDRGLNRYDHATGLFEAFFPWPDDPNHAANRIEWIGEDGRGNLWLGTRAGLWSFGFEDERFTSYADHLVFLRRPVIDVSDSGVVSAAIPGNEGFLRVDARGNARTFTASSDDPRSLNHVRINALVTDSGGDLWIGTPAGLSRLADPEAGSFEHFRPGQAAGLPSDSVRALHYDGAGSLWIAGPQHLLRFSVSTRTVEEFHPVARAGHIEGSSILRDSRNRLWIYPFYGGPLILFDPATGSSAHFTHDVNDPASLSMESITTVYEDSGGGIWILPGAGGINRVDPQRKAFRHVRPRPDLPHGLPSAVVNRFAERPDGRVWVATNAGIALYDPATSSFSPFYEATGVALPRELSMTGVVFVDRAGALWAGAVASMGLFRFDPARRRWQRFVHHPDDLGTLGSDRIWTIYEDHAGAVWVLSTGGFLSRFDRSTGTFRVFRHDPADPGTIVSGQISSIVEDEHGTKWFATYNGLSRLDEESGTFTHYRNEPGNPYSLSNNWVMSLQIDRSGIIWLGTVGGGLNRFDPRSETFTFYSEEHGLSHDEILGIVEDDHGRLWLSTGTGGISRFDPGTETFRNFDVSDGLQGLEYQDVSFLRSSSGHIYFGGFNGFNVFYPDDITDDTAPPPVLLTGLRLFNEPFTFERALAETDEAVLSHSQNALSFEFVALNYSNVVRNRYSYKLEGFDGDWHDAGDRREASYTNLPPGRYTFRVRAANADSGWNAEGASLRIVILPPWWRTVWAYGLYGLMFTVGVFGVDRYQRRRLIEKERERARERELEQAREIERAYTELKRTQDQLVQQENLASLGQLTAGIAHEIKNPLNFVNNFSEVSLELVEEARVEVRRATEVRGPSSRKEENPIATGGRAGETGAGSVSVEDLDSGLILEILNDIQSNLRKIHEHGTRADGIVKSMLMHSRGGSGKMEKTDLNALVKEYVNLAFHGMRARKDPINVDIKLDLDTLILEVPLIAEDFSRVILNLCNNAFDAMRETAEIRPPKLTVRTTTKDGALTIEIHDNGPGIPDEIKDKILQPFFTTKKGTQGTGLGLSITYDIIKAHGGSMDIRSQPGQTVFSVTLDRKN